MAQTLSEQSPLQGVEYAGGDFAALLQKEFKPRSDEAKSAVEAAVQTLAQQALAQTQLIGKDVTQSILAMIAAIDRTLTEQVNRIIHNPDFQQLESAWRGLHYMVNNTETDENLKIRVMDISRKELARNLKKFKGTAWDQSPHKPAEYDDPDATANANLAARLPYLFACNRFAHYLKCIVRDKIGSFKERADMERWLNKWIMNYVDGDPANSSEITKSQKPLAAAEVVVEEVEGNPGYYTSKFFLRPHYQLEGLTVSLRLVSKLPSAKGAGG